MTKSTETKEPGTEKVVQMPNGASTQGSLALQPAIPTPVLPDPSQLNAITALAQGVAYSGLVRTNAARGSQQAIADALFIMMMGFELGISPITALNTIYVVSGRPTTSGQAMLSLMRRAGVSVQIPDVGKIKDSATVRIRRRDSDDWMEFTYTEQMAKEANLLGKDNWKGHKREMLLWRAVATAGRFGCPDIIGGLYTIEEMQPDVPVNESGDVVSYDDIVKNSPQKSNSGESGDGGSGGKPEEKASLSEADAVKLYSMAEAMDYHQDNNAKLFEALSNAQDDKAAITRLSEWPGTLTQARAALVAHHENYDIKAVERYTLAQKADYWFSVYEAAKPICAKNKTVPPAPAAEDSTGQEKALWTDVDSAFLTEFLENIGVDLDECLQHYQVKTIAELPDRHQVESAMRDMAIRLQNPLRFTRVTYAGQFTVAHVNHASKHPIDVRLYGRDHFRGLGELGSSADWTIVDSWEKGESYDLPETLMINPHTWEAKDNYIVAQKGAVTLADIPF